MSKQPEAVLEHQLIEQLQKLGYKKVSVTNEQELIGNLKTQLEKHNNTTFSQAEFNKVINILNKGSVFEKAKKLRQTQHITRDDGSSLYFEFINTKYWCQNQYQVTQQVTMHGKYETRYDVTILINGLPLVQIELKRKGLELKEAFHQTHRYQHHSYGAGIGLFQYIQLFVISNGVNTKYFANNKRETFKQTFYWTDKDNKRLTNILNGFSEHFLEPCHLSKMICKYIVLNETNKILMVLRPYQYYAVEAIIDRVNNSTKNGYIWHTTGSGKTLTSFKASQILIDNPKVHKVVFVVDRKDLDNQTQREFDSFKKDCVDNTTNTNNLVKQLTDDTKLIVTTIQKLNNAISNKRYLSKVEKLKDEKIVFIFDECHRSQFGETHKRITNFFTNHQLFGFTGTPILADNASKNELGYRTTIDLFHECLHKYVITDAIRDQNVLKFSIEYVGRYKRKESATEIDIEVEDIDTKELMESPERLNKIVNFIIDNHNRKTHNRKFNSMFCISSTEQLIAYYRIFKQLKDEGKHDLKIATIFSYAANEPDPDANGLPPDDLPGDEEQKVSLYKRDALEEFIGHYNETFGTKYTTKDSKSFYNYYREVSERTKNKEVDILLVVNMFLTGFDAKELNTLYVDKNLKYHGLIQAYSRTNRIKDERKSQGNIVVFRNLKKATDQAITLFSNKDAIEVIVMQPYEEYVEKFNEKVEELLKIVPTADAVNELVTEQDELEFIKAFRELMRVLNVVKGFADFKWEDVAIDSGVFDAYKSKYVDLNYKVKENRQKEKVSILDDVDFELELIHRDEVNVYYIMQLLVKLKRSTQKDVSKLEAEIFNLLTNETNLRSKKELIEKFIQNNLPEIDDENNVQEEFDKFWSEEQKVAFQNLIKEEGLDPLKTEQLIEGYLFSEQPPRTTELLELLKSGKPSALQRKTIAKRLLNRIVGFVDTFVNGMVG